MVSRRGFLGGAAATLVGAGLVARAGAASIPEAQIITHAKMMPQPAPTSGRPYHPVVTLNGWSAPWRMKDGWKEFHLIAEPVIREMAPGMKATLWGYNGGSPGPTIEVVEGDKVRIFVTNKLPEPTTIHWHGQRLPNGMDGVGGLVQPQIPVGKTYVYEFVPQRPGTFMYHPHADEMTQMAMGMMGFWVTHPKGRHPAIEPVDRDFCFLINAYDIDPGSAAPSVNTMLDFNLWTWNSRAFPGTDGGPVPKSARCPEVTTDIAVGQMRQIEFVADEEGDWAFHCHKSHHTMNAMGHAVPTMIGVDYSGLAGKISKLIPDYMAMGERGMADMAEMEMPLPDNTLPMMTGKGPFGPVEMGGMFSVMKVRRGQKRGDYSDPGWYKQPPGTQARELAGAMAEPMRAPSTASPQGSSGDVEVTVRKPVGHAGH